MSNNNKLHGLPHDSFENKVRKAARRLLQKYPNGKASDVEIFEVVKSVGLSVLFESASYTLDPAASIVALVAFKNAGEKEIKKYFRMYKHQHVKR